MKNMCGTTSDIISDLPDTIIEKILVRMPIRDAVRTSVLSKKWRFNWINIPVLAFDDTSLVDPYPTFFCQLLPPDQLSIKNRLLATIYHVLLLHRGPILKFSLSISELKSCSEIDALISILSNRGIQELTLQIQKGDPHELPQSLFSCQQSTYLNLHSCVFKRPTTFKGFPWVVCLELLEVIITADLFETFVSSCPVLEQLTFESSARFDFNGIDAPNLKVLSLMGIFKSISVKNAPKVANFSIHSKAFVGVVGGGGGKFDWAGLLDGLPVLKSVYGRSISYGDERKKAGLLRLRMKRNKRSTSDIISYLPSNVTENILKDLPLKDAPEEETDSEWVKFFRSLPAIEDMHLDSHLLQILNIPPIPDHATEFLQAQDFSDFSLNKLQEVEIRHFSGAEPEMLFVEILLAHSVVLKKMVIWHEHEMSDKKGFAMVKELTRFPRASSDAELVIDANVRLVKLAA
ncbi:hypothetical protein RHSIM_Rhsim12G0069400 [Rhododendron simsii]|uniref:F-box domain-containing protein n=1 Tax=Rhododendron simsii TaxID=118357 RepID=A0A834G313_RHOSS|nr:hypothetical protein RHSIM_Rhsim12G0069400 [Rhododendron simsii]